MSATLRPTTAGTIMAMAMAGLFPAAGIAVAEGRLESPDSLHIDYSRHPDGGALEAFELSIVSPNAEVDLTPAQALGNRVLAYISIAEVANDADYAAAAQRTGVAYPAENPAWSSRIADLSDDRWQAFVLDQLATPAAEAGFDGFFLDTLDSVAHLIRADPDRGDSFHRGLVDLIRQIRQRFPDKAIVINRGFEVFDEVRDEVDGVLIESVLQSYDFHQRRFAAVAAEQTAQLVAWIERIRAAGLPVLAVDFVDPESSDLALETSARLHALGCTPLITTPEFDGRPVPAQGRVARRILVLHGHGGVGVGAEAEARTLPADTVTTSLLQMPLEWMGYELEYHDINEGLPARGTDEAWAGIIFDEHLSLPMELEEACLEWLAARRAEGKKLLFVGDYPFADEILRGELFQLLGIRGGDLHTAPQSPGGQLREPRITLSDPRLLNFETEALPSLRDFQAVRAPDGARVMLSLSAIDVHGHRIDFDPIYTAPWGGCLLSPYVVFEASEETALSYIDPFAFLENLWPSGDFPAPDPSTRDGLRAFYSHIDGDGFTSLTSVEDGRLCGELIYDRLLADLPFPITVSVIEAEIRADMMVQDRSHRPRFEEAARRIFALPQVEPASHSYSHPYVWFDDDTSYLGLYRGRNLDLKFTARYPQVEIEREIAGSLEFIDEALTPPGKPSTLMLWSGNCRPGAEALRHAAARGVECLNGGNTILSRRFPGLSAVAPRVIYWEDQLQVYASNQNEFMYTNGWTGPYYGGFRQVIETFEMTDTHRRLKPVNVYYHFYSVERHDALRALEEIYNWCESQDLHAMTASSFARLTRDSHHTRIYRAGPRRWIALNKGHLRTFRLPKGSGVPDLHACRGVSGYTEHRDWIYVHTTGRARTVIAVDDSPAPHFRLESSSAEIDFARLEPQLAAFSVRDFRPIRVVLAGLSPNADVVVVIDGETQRHPSDADGRLHLDLPPQANVRVSSAD